jgi:hypothetical protein
VVASALAPFWIAVEATVMATCRFRTLGGMRVGLCRWRFAEASWRKVDEALQIIQTYDPRRFRRLRADVARVVVIPSRRPYFSPFTRTCYLDASTVNARGNGVVACSVVHEAVHARLRQKGLGAFTLDYVERVEELCMDEEIAFARSSPRTPQRDEFLSELAELRRTYPPTQAWPPKQLNLNQRRTLWLLLGLLVAGNVDLFAHLRPPLAVATNVIWVVLFLVLVGRMVLRID